MSKLSRNKQCIKIKVRPEFRMENTADICRKYMHQAYCEYKKTDGMNQFPASSYDMDEPMIKRRVRAIVNTTNKAYDCAKDIIPDDAYPHLKNYNTREDWIAINSMAKPSLDEDNNDFIFTLGAAIWMLDALRDNGNLEKAKELMPKDKESLCSVAFPHCWDTAHGEEVLRSMVYVITNRNLDCKRNKSESRAIGTHDYYDKLTIEGEQHQDVASREVFDKIIGLIDKDAISKAVENFERYIWESSKSYYQIRKVFLENEQDLIVKLKGIKETYDSKIDILNKRASFNEPSAVKLPDIKANPEQALKVFAEQQNKISFSSSFPSSIRPSSLLGIDECNLHENKLDALYMEANSYADEIADKFQESENALQEIIHYFICRPTWTKETWTKKYGEDVAKYASGFSISDPYEACFALLYLADTNNDLAYLLYPVHRIMSFAAAELPWCGGVSAYQSFRGRDSMEWAQQTEETINNTEEIENEKSARMYAMDKVDRRKFLDEPVRTSMARILYEYTGVIAPRDKTALKWQDNSVQSYENISDEDKGILLQYLDCYHSSYDRSHFSAEKEENESFQKVSSELREAQAEVKKLKKEKEKLERQLHSAEQKARKEAAKRQEEEKQYEVDRGELANLREALFKIAQDDNADETQNETANIEYPYETKGNLIAFGGHEHWLKGIKPLLPTVRFFDNVPAEEVIRNADAVWLQVNALKHPKFYKIVNVAKQWNVPIRYFMYSSFSKCADQLVEEDKKGYQSI